MAIKNQIPISFNLDSHQSVQSVCAVIHIDDKNTETLDLSLMQGGEHITVSQNSTVTARFVRVKDKILISDNVPCAVQGNGNLYIPIDNAAAHMLVGEIKIEVNIVNENDILTMQFPLVIRVNNTILADAEISPESEGTIPELLEEAREAAESATQAAEAATKAISTKQDKLTAGENITIDDNNVISAEGGGVTDYDELTSKPQINGVTLSGNKTTFDLNIETGTDDYDELENKPQIENYSPNQSKKTNELKNTVSFYPFTSSVSNGELRLRFDEKTVIKCNTATNTISSLDSLSEHIYNSFTYFQYIGQQIAPFINPKYNMLSLFDYRPANGGWTQLLFWEDATTNKPKCAFRYTNYNSTMYNVQFKELGSQIVSGVVNANGTITFTDSEGNTFTTSGESVIGPQGAPGQDYVLTAQDKTDIANIVLSELPTTEGVLYGNQSN